MRTFSALSGAARQLWAKSGSPVGHGLLAHLLDVSAVVEAILQFEPASTRRWAAERFGLDERHAVRWLAAMAGLHDFGKAIPGFQKKWPEGERKDSTHGLVFPQGACRVDRHDLATAALLARALNTAMELHGPWFEGTAGAVAAHHGHHFTLHARNSCVIRLEPATWAATREEILRAYWLTLSPSGSPKIETLDMSAINWLAGLTSAADWIASNSLWFTYGQRGYDDLADYYAASIRMAEQALTQIGWHRHRVLHAEHVGLGELLSRIVGSVGITPRPLQMVGDGLLQTARGPSLLLVEAPMGEGKTELAFLAHLRLQATNGHRGLYVAMPTQATGNAMFKRAVGFLTAFVGQASDVQLVHGGAAFSADALRLRAIGGVEVGNESLSASVWFSQRRRPLLAPYGVGTVDQALLAVLNVKHHFVRLWGLSNRVIVLDEIHAYDTYTTGLIAALLRWLHKMGCSVVLMSATLPAARRAELLGAWGVDDPMPMLAYPRVMLADRDGLRGESFRARQMPTIRVRGIPEDLESLAISAASQWAMGGCGAVIVNTVDRAQKLFLMLRERLGPDARLSLFHARYPADRRGELEREVLGTFGFDGQRPAQALLIATQVVEQSLDLDFDFMLSDLAPVDLLLQRAGRLHRHVRDRPPAHANACLLVSGLVKDRMPDLKSTAWSFVYDDYILGRTWALLGEKLQLQLPGDIDRLVQAVYDIETPLPEHLHQTVLDHIEIDSYGKYLGRIQNERRMASQSVIDSDLPLSEAYAAQVPGSDDEDGWVARTRLGRPAICLIPVDMVDGTWPFDPKARFEEAVARRYCSRQIKISHPAVYEHFKTLPHIAAFADHPLLAHCVPLPLQDGAYRVEGVSLRLDETIGLVYE